MTPELSLAERARLPDALRVLVDEFPRTIWQTHPNFRGTVQFWLERHLMFRKLLSMLQDDAQSALDRNISMENYAPRLSKFAGLFLNELHTHHHVEDSHYFPQLIKLDARLEHGFDMLDSDHNAIDLYLNGLADSANAILQSKDVQKVGTLDERLSEFHRLLDRHLTDEEELIVPVILKTGFDG